MTVEHSSRFHRFTATNVIGGDSDIPHIMLDFNNMQQTDKHRIPTTQFSTSLIVLVAFILFLISFATCVMVITYIRRKLKKRDSMSLICRSETSETMMESTLINNNNLSTTYHAINVE